MNNYIFSIDTKLIKEKDSISNFVYEFPFQLKNVIEINLSSVEIPNSIYVFTESKDNDYMVLKIHEQNFRFYLPNGNYDIKELYDNLNKFFNEIEKYQFFEKEFVQIGLAFDVDIAKFKINSNVPFSLYFYNSTEYQSLGTLLGFAKMKYENVQYLVSELIPDIIGDKYIFMKINDFGNVYHNDNQYFSKIIIDKESFEMIFNSQHTYITKEYRFKNPVNLNNIKVKFEDYLGNLINFNGVDLSFTLEVKTINTIKNKIINKFYSSFSYDPAFLKLILHDAMLKHYLGDKKFDMKNLGKKYLEIINSS
tara:strand:- start:126 stop:1049 length:924 start_codon:yes stop_codon:yes gene_type:complete